MISRKHFIAMAQILKDNQASDRLIGDIATWFKSQNARFDRDRFFTAAKPESDGKQSCSNNVQPVIGVGRIDVHTSKKAS